MKENKTNKECILQVRCTEDEKKLLDKYVQKSGMKRSDYMRAALFMQGNQAAENVQFTVKAQELINHLEKSDTIKTMQIERMVDELWELL